MVSEDGDVKYVCHDCIGDDFLADEVEGNGVDAVCFFCRESRGAWPLAAMANRIGEVLQDHFNLTTDDYQYGMTGSGSFDWIPVGDVLGEVVGEMAGIDHEIALAVVEHLNESTRRDVIKDGATDFYGFDAYYEERGANDQDFQHT